MTRIAAAITGTEAFATAVMSAQITGGDPSKAIDGALFVAKGMAQRISEMSLAE